MRTIFTMTSNVSNDKPIATTKLHRRSHSQPVVAPRRGTRVLRGMRDWFGMCWGRARGSDDGETIGERERLLGPGKLDEERWESDEETECEYDDGGEEEDRRLIGVDQDGTGKLGHHGLPKRFAGKRWKGMLTGARRCSRWT